MTKSTVANPELGAFLRALKNRLAELGSGDRSREALAIETSADELDRIQQATDRDYAIGNLERTSSQLREVQSALLRVDEGTYGICIGCEETIGPKRLAAIPWASFCIVCQERADCEQKTSEDEIDSGFLTAA
jgi:DnaK suppressor protein